jgi:sugar O-acyltransferase (sialic acid O-acetyltransferase NeuD family)
MKSMVIVGAGGHAREIHQIVDDINAVSPTWRIRCFAVEPEHRIASELLGLPILTVEEACQTHPAAHFVLGVGSGMLRSRLAARLGQRSSDSFPTLVHPRARYGPRVEIGPGCVLFPGSIITNDVRLGCHVHLNLYATISHDCTVGDFATLGPHASCCGSVSLGESVELGAGAIVIPKVKVGARSIVGAGAVVTRDCPEGVTTVGIPAKVTGVDSTGDSPSH